MSIKFRTNRHRINLYNIFDNVRLYNFAILDSNFVRDMLDNKLTHKSYRQIENEWLVYWEETCSEIPIEKDKLMVLRVNSRQLLLIKAGYGTHIARTVHDVYEDLFKSSVSEIYEDE